MNQYTKSSSLDVQQRCLEFKALLNHSEAMVEALPIDASCEDIEVDESLSFLQPLVNQALASGQ